VKQTPLARKTPLGRKPRARGNRGELEVVNILKAHGYPAYRNFASGGYGGSDVIGLPGFAVEVKMVEALNIWKALAQSEEAASATETPTVVFRRNRSRWYVALPFEDFLGLVEEAQS
jgi:Holliday junction resolvase